MLAPLAIAAIGFRSILEGITTWHNKEIKQRKTRYAGALATIGLTVAATILAAGTVIAAPIVLPLLFTAIVGVGLAKEAYIYHQAKQAVKALEADIETSKAALKIAIQQKSNPTEINRLASNVVAQQQQWQRMKLNQSHLKVNLAASVMSVIGVALFVGGVFFPPLAAAGALILLTMGVVTAIQKRRHRNAMAQLEKTIRTQTPMELEKRIQDKLSKEIALGDTQRNTLSVGLHQPYGSETDIYSEIRPPINQGEGFFNILNNPVKEETQSLLVKTQCQQCGASRDQCHCDQKKSETETNSSTSPSSHP